MTLMLGGVPDWVMRGLVRIGLFREEPSAPVLHPPPVRLEPDPDPRVGPKAQAAMLTLLLLNDSNPGLCAAMHGALFLGRIPRGAA